MIDVLSQVAGLVLKFTQVCVILDVVINVAAKISHLYIHHIKLVKNIHKYEPSRVAFQKVFIPLNLRLSVY